MPYTKSVLQKFDTRQARELLPQTWLVFPRIPGATEFGALRHAPRDVAKGAVVMRLNRAPRAADLMQLSHAPEGWRFVMILPANLKKTDMASFTHLRKPVEVLIPGMGTPQVEYLLKDVKNAKASTLSTTVCGHLLRH